MPTKVTIEFCAFCAAILPEDFNEDEAPECPNCGEDINDNASRITGTFDSADAEKLRSV